MWPKKRDISRELSWLTMQVFVKVIPCCVVAYKIKLQAAEKKAKKKIGAAIKIEAEIALKIKLISPYKLIVKGPPKFIIMRINQKKDNVGLVLSKPLLIIILREWLCSQIMFAPANIPEETKPWASIIHQTPAILIISNLKRAKITSDM